ncbi:NAD(P)-binding protein [Choiromyces venosus 120613-1]|uniref:NAD(P)-binding protein n=1 Tax=Choiromyces venosus 120613-1 TaxID=1336337 RepID=A0A3N4JVF6_9PEZI|nr:NAD(P)-binding protein [Choiromyces venosus 120613-1]
MSTTATSITSTPKTWLITGCSSGFGSALALAVLASGDKLICTARNTTALTHLTKLGAVALALDLTSPPATIQAIITSAVTDHGPIGYLVNNAGVITIGALESYTAAEIQEHFTINVFSHITVMQAILPHMRSRRSGVIANIGSIAGWGGGPGLAAYCASKHALAAFTLSLQQEVASFGVTVTCVELGYFRTGILEDAKAFEPKKVIPEYDDLMRGARGALKGVSWKQPGDPKKGAELVVEMLSGRGRGVGRVLPGRWVVGRDAIAFVEASLKRGQDMLDGWREVVSTTDYDDVDPTKEVFM